jgi:error-prone DNA polymerase
MYTELQVTSNFSFLRGASHPDELVGQAAALGYEALAITDRNTVAGVVRAHVAAKKAGLRLIPGACLELQDGHHLLALPVNRQGWASLCALLSAGNLRTEKGDCLLYREDVYRHAGDMHFIALAPESLGEDLHYPTSFLHDLAADREAFGDRLSLAATRRYLGEDGKQLHRLSQLARQLSIPLVATNDVYYHEPQRRRLQDVLTCIREKCTIQSAGYRLLSNAERYLKPPEEMERLFRQYPEALERAAQVGRECCFSLDELQYEYPEEITTEGRSPQEELTRLAWHGATEIFGEPLPPKTVAAIRHELHFIEQMNYAAYFLTVYDIVRFARSRGILCQGRGSAANSTVCFCLGITSVNPEKFDLLFERFISAARNEPPDIDVDFEHERREEVIQYIYGKYGRDRAAIVATVTCQHSRGAIRDVGKAMGLSADTIQLLAGISCFREDGFDERRIEELGMNPQDTYLRKVLQLTHQFIGFPRQLGQHTGGFIITRGRLTDLCPVLNARMPGRTCIEWNKDDIEALGFLKVDVLALGMLTCIRKAFTLVREHYGRTLTLANIPQDDGAVYDMICAADTIGVFQIESRAQQSMLPRLRPRTFYDLVIEVAIVRPGPIQGDMVHPYLRRRNGQEEVSYPSAELEEILKRTLGVPLFQEQAMKIAIAAAGFTPAEADGLRRSMATFKFKGVVSQWQEKLVSGMMQKGYTEEYAVRVFRQLEGFGSYGFPESHAASFALLVYVSAWIKCHYPDVFAAALLNSQPMGFYQPAQIVRDAREHGVEVREVDINHSCWDHCLEPLTAGEGKKLHALRLGFRQVKGLRQQDMEVLLGARKNIFTRVDELREAGLSQSAMEVLAGADAFRSLGLDRRQALWEAGTHDASEALFTGQPSPDSIGEEVSLPSLLPSEQVVQDYATTSLSLKAHPVSFVRHTLDQLSIQANASLSSLRNGQGVKVAGLVLVRQRPGTAKGVCFMTIEDESGVANIVIFQQLFEQYRRVILSAKLIMIEGTLQVEGAVIHVVARSLHNFSPLLRKLLPPDPDTTSSLRPAAPKREGQETLFPDARDFR